MPFSIKVPSLIIRVHCITQTEERGLLEKYKTRSYISGCTEFHLLTKSLKLQGIDSIKVIDLLSTIPQNFSQLIIKQAQVNLVIDCHQLLTRKSS